MPTEINEKEVQETEEKHIKGLVFKLVSPDMQEIGMPALFTMLGNIDLTEKSFKKMDQYTLKKWGPGSYIIFTGKMTNIYHPSEAENMLKEYSDLKNEQDGTAVKPGQKLSSLVREMNIGEEDEEEVSTDAPETE